MLHGIRMPINMAKDDVRMELMERLRKAGFEIRLVEETCEHYAVIDNEIVWYGSVNLLSKGRCRGQFDAGMQ